LLPAPPASILINAQLAGRFRLKPFGHIHLKASQQFHAVWFDTWCAVHVSTRLLGGNKYDSARSPKLKSRFANLEYFQDKLNYFRRGFLTFERKTS
jgi:hypothetical protein